MANPFTPLERVTLEEIEERMKVADPAPWCWDDWERNAIEHEMPNLERDAVLEWSPPDFYNGANTDVLPFDRMSPWSLTDRDGYPAYSRRRYIANAEFIAHSRWDVEWLLALIKELAWRIEQNDR